MTYTELLKKRNDVGEQMDCVIQFIGGVGLALHDPTYKDLQKQKQRIINELAEISYRVDVKLSQLESLIEWKEYKKLVKLYRQDRLDALEAYINVRLKELGVT